MKSVAIRGRERWPGALLLVAAGACVGAIGALAPRAASADPPDAGAERGERGGVHEHELEHEQEGEGARHEGHHVRCREQHAQPFLIRSNYVTGGGMTREERHRREAAHQTAIRWRTEHYGYFEGFGESAWNPHPPRYYAQTTHFMGLPVRVHRRIVPALECVEQELHRACASEHYTPHALAGIRFQNTYHTGEITNHAYGIAVDVDPDRNTCCGCVGHWAQHPLCRRPMHSIEDRMAMPQCWVHAFERYGFYWLGHDPMHDTMHFEFLGDPDRIVR